MARSLTPRTRIEDLPAVETELSEEELSHVVGAMPRGANSCTSCRTYSGGMCSIDEDYDC